MTIDQFWIQLRTLKDNGWHLDPDWNYVRDKDGYCPMAAVARSLGYDVFYCSFTKSADLLGLPHSFANKVASAADQCIKANEPFRTKLFEVLGIDDTRPVLY